MLNSGLHSQPDFYDSVPEQNTEKEKTYRLNQVAIRMVEMPPLLSEIPIDGPEAAVKVMADLLKDYDREVVAIVNMQSDGRPINMNIVSMGALDQSIAHPREILKSTILSNAASIIYRGKSCEAATSDNPEVWNHQCSCGRCIQEIPCTDYPAPE